VLSVFASDAYVAPIGNLLQPHSTTELSRLLPDELNRKQVLCAPNLYLSPTELFSRVRVFAGLFGDSDLGQNPVPSGLYSGQGAIPPNPSLRLPDTWPAAGQLSRDS
jgi:hypothetical protein